MSLRPSGTADARHIVDVVTMDGVLGVNDTVDGDTREPVVVMPARYCPITGYVLVRISIEGHTLWTNWVMSSAASVLAPAATAKLGPPLSDANAFPTMAATGMASIEARPTTGGRSTESAIGPTQTTPPAMLATVGVSPLEASMGQRAIGAMRPVRWIEVGGVRLEPAIDVFCATQVNPRSVADIVWPHRIAQAHTSTLSVARPSPAPVRADAGTGNSEADGAHGRLCGFLQCLVDQKKIKRASVLWDMRRRRGRPAAQDRCVVALGVHHPLFAHPPFPPPPSSSSLRDTHAGVPGEDDARVHLYRGNEDEILATAYEWDHRVPGMGRSIIDLARTCALARVLGVEVSATRRSAPQRLPVAPMWAIIDAGVRACHFDRVARANVVHALCTMGPTPQWRSSMVWTCGAALADECASVLDLDANEVPVLHLVLAGHRPDRPVRISIDRDAYIRVPPPHRAQFQWQQDPVGSPARRETGGANRDSPTARDFDNTRMSANTEDASGTVRPVADDEADRDGRCEQVALEVAARYAHIDIVSWVDGFLAGRDVRGRSGGLCLLGNALFYDRVALVDYEADALTLFADVPPSTPSESTSCDTLSHD